LGEAVREKAADDAPREGAPARGEAPAIERFLLIIGAMKSGTTTLFEYLAQHPEIARSLRKEPNLFGKPGTTRKTREARYPRLWPGFDPARHRYAMEASTHYTKAPRHARAPLAISRLPQETRLVYIVRDPVERIESQLAHNIAQGRIGHDVSWDHPALRQAIDVSRYAHQLARYAKAMPDREILVLDFEELKRDPLAVTRRCVDFLGIDPGFAFSPIPPANVRRSANAGDRFSLSDELRARLRAELAPDARRFARRHGFDISAWGLGTEA
jgi:hypothetical protein